MINSSPPKPYTPVQSKCSPVELFRQARYRHHPHLNELSDEITPQVARLLRTSYPHNLFRDPDPSSTPGRRTRVAIALPIEPSQRECYGQHDKFFETCQSSTPVECAICACAGDCDEDEDGDVFWMCEWCALRICGQCKQRCQGQGAVALLASVQDHVTASTLTESPMQRQED